MDTEPSERTHVPPKQVAQSLRRIFRREFGGKPGGRFRLDPPRLRKLSGRDYLRGAFIQAVSEFLLERGFVMTNAGEFFVIQRVSELEKAIRQVPFSIIREFTGIEDASN